ncbi:MAG: hypothetical protein WEA61_11195 [Anaerolineales bacterium]
MGNKNNRGGLYVVPGVNGKDQADVEDLFGVIFPQWFERPGQGHHPRPVEQQCAQLPHQRRGAQAADQPVGPHREGAVVGEVINELGDAVVEGVEDGRPVIPVEAQKGDEQTEGKDADE